MASATSTTLGVLAGLVLSLSIAVIAVIVVNGANNPGVGAVQTLESAAGGASAPLPAATGAFGSLDLNQDGRLSLAEAAGYADIVVRFNRADRNKDGRLTNVEFERLQKLPPPKPRPKPKLQLRQDAAAILAGGRREGQ